MTLLTPLQQKTLEAFFNVPELKQHFYLTGGTALAAFHLQHRLSEDLDLFTHATEIHEIERLVEDTFSQAGLKISKERGSATFRRLRINNELQVDLVKDVPFRLGAPELRDGFMVDNANNIAVNKVSALYGRLDPKDYVDLYFLKSHIKFEILELLRWAKQKDSGIENFQWAKVIADVDTINVLPNLIKPVELKNLKHFFHSLRKEVIDAAKPKKE